MYVPFVGGFRAFHGRTYVQGEIFQILRSDIASVTGVSKPRWRASDPIDVIFCNLVL